MCVVRECVRVRVRAHLQLGGGALEVERRERRVRRGPAARVPDGGALQEHLLAVAERVAALAAARARRVEVVVLTGLRRGGHGSLLAKHIPNKLTLI